MKKKCLVWIKSIGIYAPDGEMERHFIGEKGYYEFL